MRINTNQKGFTLIELMIVIAIIGILAAVAIPNYIAFKNKAYCTASVNDTKAAGAALADYFAVPSNLTANTYRYNANAGGRPFILIGDTPMNTLLLSASTSGQTATAAGSNILIVTNDISGQCPAKVTSSDTHWTGGSGTATTYSMTL